MSTGAHLDHLLLELLLLLGDSLVENTWSVGKHEPTHRMRVESGDMTLDFFERHCCRQVKKTNRRKHRKTEETVDPSPLKDEDDGVTIIREATFWQWATWTEA